MERPTCLDGIQTRIQEQWHALMVPHEIFHWPGYVIFADARNIPLYLCLQVTRLKCTFLQATNEKWEDQWTDNGEETVRHAIRGYIYKFFLGKRKELMRLGGMVDSCKKIKKKKERERKKKEKEKRKKRIGTREKKSIARMKVSLPTGQVYLHWSKVAWIVRRPFFPFSSTSFRSEERWRGLTS